MEFLNGGYNWYYAKDYIVAHKKDMIQYCFYVFKNDLEISFNGKTYEVNPGDMMITSKGLPHTVSGKGEEYYIDWIIMSLDANDLHILQNLHLPLNTILHIGNSLMLSNIILNCCYTADFQKGDRQ